ncbi:P-loop NTPase fold protein, partial [Asticcacaulis biprosthecium]|uniref:P-loop NTPase fold protein n=1 Tax=Asticcacaulis biprosthecium TaxID=76891 RepID=UPI00059124F7
MVAANFTIYFADEKFHTTWLSTGSGEMSRFFNDSPIESAGDDQYGISPFAKAIAKSLHEIVDPIGTTIAINGPWGAGKSSAVNLIRHELQAMPDTKLTLLDFKCWWYRGEEALTLAFFQELNSTLKLTLGEKVKNLVPALGRHV